jgi:DNA-binding GntR family transcriptional regulator
MRKAAAERNSEPRPASTRPLRPESLVDLAHRDLQLRIASGAMRPGDRVVIDALAREYGTSQIPVREALVRLHAERFVTFERNKGYRVAPKPGALEMRHLFEARLILEIGAVDRGLGRADAGVIAELAAINTTLAGIDAGRSIDDYRRFITTNERFHILLVGLCDNPFVIDSYNRLGYHQRIIQILYGRGVPDSARILREHDEIIAALSRGDRDAVRAAMRDHIVGGYERLEMPPD